MAYLLSKEKAGKGPVSRIKPLLDKNIDFNATPSSPFEMNTPAFMMCPPFYASTDVANNVWMEELKGDDAKLDMLKALNQWTELYTYLSSLGLVYLLPPERGLQDLVFVANAGVYIDKGDKPNIAISNFKSEPRRGETKVIDDFFKLFEANTQITPEFFEGQADFKRLNKDVYIGAHGIRTSKNVHKWFEEQYDIKVIPLEMKNKYLYHLDCLVFPITADKTLVCTSVVDPKTIKEIEKYTEIIDVDLDSAMSGITNSLRAGKIILCGSSLYNMSEKDEFYEEECVKVDLLSDICSSNGLELALFDLSEFYKQGACLSCLIMNLNYIDYKFNNV